MFVIRNKGIFISISVLLVVASLVLVGVFGMKLSIDFTGGALTEVAYPQGRPAFDVVETSIEALDLGSFSLRPSGDDSFLLRTKDLTDEQRQAVLQALSLNNTYPTEAKRFTSIGPTIGSELRSKAVEALTIVVIAIILFIAFAFRKVSKPVSSWKYGVIAVVALIHDVIIPTGVFAVLGQYAGYEIDSLFVTALLVILGYSVNDTIVVFDRIRENLKMNRDTGSKESFADAVGKSIDQTFGRSINTSLTVIIVLCALFVLGGPSVHAFSLALLIGVISGTYSSIFLASPLLVLWEGKTDKK